MNRSEQLPEPHLTRAILAYQEEERRLRYAKEGYNNWWEVNKQRVLDREEKQAEEYYLFLVSLNPPTTPFTAPEQKFIEMWEAKKRGDNFDWEGFQCVISCWLCCWLCCWAAVV